MVTHTDIGIMHRRPWSDNAVWGRCDPCSHCEAAQRSKKYWNLTERTAMCESPRLSVQANTHICVSVLFTYLRKCHTEQAVVLQVQLEEGLALRNEPTITDGRLVTYWYLFPLDTAKIMVITSRFGF